MYRKEMAIARECKNRGYWNIIKCPNVKVRESSLKIMELVERIPMRGVFIGVNDNNNFTLYTGLKTTQNVLMNVFIPLTEQFKLEGTKSFIQEKIDEISKSKYRTKYRMDILDFTTKINTMTLIELQKTDSRYWLKKHDTIKNELYYTYGSFGERKLIAYHNKTNKLKKVS